MNGFIKIDFEKGESPMLYRDALYLPEDHSFTDEEIESMKEERYQNWLLLIKTASESSEVSVNG